MLCGIHGDELTSLRIAAQLKKVEIEKGSLHIFFGINELGNQFGKRFADADLNRVFPGKLNGNFEERLAAHLLNELQEMDLVVDLHCFEMESPVTALQFTKEDEFINAFNPEEVWLIDTAQVETKYLTALGPLLARQGKKNFAVELDMLEHFTSENRVMEGFRNLFRKLGMLSGKVSEHHPTRFKRKETTSDVAGIFIPEKKPLVQVKRGEQLGKIISLKDLSENPILCNQEGVLMQIRRTSQVRTGTLLFAIGEVQ